MSRTSGFDGQSGPGPAGLSETDLDRLADFLADALDHANAAEVARLIAADSGWARAHGALVEADRRVRDDLAVAAQGSTVMPADIAGRLDHAVSDLGRTPTVASLDEARTVRAGRGRRRRLFTTIAAAAAAAVTIVGGVAVVGRLATEVAPSAMSDVTAEKGGPAMAGAPTAAAGQPRIVASGTDYTTATLPQISTQLLSRNNALTKDTDTAAPSQMRVPDSAPGALAHLGDPVVLELCLRSILAAHPGAVQVVDFARYDGQPALIVLVQQGPVAVAVAAGPGCGPNGADEKDSAPVG